MNGPQDLGGRDGFGPVVPEVDEPLFHGDWEKRALGLTLAAASHGHWTIDESRHAREDRAPVEYYTLSYYGIWIAALERLLVRHGMVTASELKAGRTDDPGPLKDRTLRAEAVVPMLDRGGPADRDPKGSVPAFAPGDKVQTRNLQPAGHIRLPSYARDKSGTVAAVRGHHLFPDTSAKGDRETAHWLYTIAFDAAELFGDRGRAGDTVQIDAWEPYLDRA